MTSSELTNTAIIERLRHKNRKLSAIAFKLLSDWEKQTDASGIGEALRQSNYDAITKLATTLRELDERTPAERSEDNMEGYV